MCDVRTVDFLCFGMARNVKKKKEGGKKKKKMPSLIYLNVTHSPPLQIKGDIFNGMSRTDVMRALGGIKRRYRECCDEDQTKFSLLIGEKDGELLSCNKYVVC